MTSRISPEDWEILSAYVDGQASAREQEKLRQKIETEPELQRALEELQRTKMVLRSAPRRRVPHNFTLTPAMLPQRKPWFRLVPTLSFASGMAVLLLVLTFAFSSLPGLTGASSLAALPPAPTQAPAAPNLAAPLNDQSNPSSANPPIIVWGGGGFGGGGGGGDGSGQATGLGGGGPEATVVAPPAVTEQGIGGGPTPVTGLGGAEPLVTPTPGPQDLTPTPPETSTSPSIAALPTETPSAPKAFTATSQPLAAQPGPQENSGPILGIRPTQEMGKIVVEPGTDQFAAPPTRNAAQAAPQSLLSQNLVAIQIGLGILALATALAAILLRRRS